MRMHWTLLPQNYKTLKPGNLPWMRGKKPLLSKTKEEISDQWSLITTNPPFITGHDAAASAPPHSQSFQFVGPTLWFLSILFHVNSFHKGLNQPFTSKLTALLGPFPILENIILLGHPCLKWITSCFFYHGPPTYHVHEYGKFHQQASAQYYLLASTFISSERGGPSLRYRVNVWTSLLNMYVCP